MDFWSRLVGGASRATPTKQTAVNDSKQRLTRFRQVHNQLLADSNAAGKSFDYLRFFRQALQDEIQSPAPHPCIAYVASSQAYDIVTKIALSSFDERHIHEALDFLNILLDSEEGEFLEDDGFADILIKFVNDISSSGTILVSAQIEGEIVEILFGIASKLRIQPEILPAWFRPRIHGPADILGENSDASHLNSGKVEFPLFYFLLNYVHHDGRAGDFARTGLLYLIEAAAHDEELEKWIVESDLATLMASGLGALYSRLSSKLILSYAKDSVPAIVAFSEVPRRPPISDAEETGSPEFQVLLGTFLSHLMFWQDVLEHCTSIDIKQSLLDHFQYLFLQQLLYPSLLESSDVDGGSSVAVLTYLCCILESISHPDLVRLILQYLLALPEANAEDMTISRPTTLARQRKSQTLMTNLAKGEEKPSPTLFTLVDLILTSLQSRNQQTVTATLRLCSVIIRSQHPYAVSTLIRVKAQSIKIAYPTIGKHDLEIDSLLFLAENLASQDGLDESYEAHLHDVRNVLEAHSCSTKLLALPGNDLSLNQSPMPKHPRTRSTFVGPHKIASDDPFLDCLLSLLKNFLVNDIETNLSLTQTFTNLASCGFTRLEGWILGDGSKDTYSVEQEVSGDEIEDKANLPDGKASNSNEDQAAKAHALRKARQKPLELPESESPVFFILDSLVKQVESFRHKVQDFDIYLLERKHIFKVGEEIDSVLADSSIPLGKSEDSKGTSPTTLQNPNHISSISQRLLIENSSSNASRAPSPRGRQHNDSSASRLIGRLNHLRISPSPSPAKTGPRAYSPSPLRKNSLPSTPPKIATPTGPADALLQKIKLSTASKQHQNMPDVEGSETSSVRSESIGTGATQVEEFRDVSLGHLLTNIIILQEFILELAALVEVRASLFGEVRFV